MDGAYGSYIFIEFQSIFIILVRNDFIITYLHKFIFLYWQTKVNNKFMSFSCYSKILSDQMERKEYNQQTKFRLGIGNIPLFTDHKSFWHFI